jgi:hypothetical protein
MHASAATPVRGDCQCMLSVGRDGGIWCSVAGRSDQYARTCSHNRAWCLPVGRAMQVMERRRGHIRMHLLPEAGGQLCPHLLPHPCMVTATWAVDWLCSGGPRAHMCGSMPDMHAHVPCPKKRREQERPLRPPVTAGPRICPWHHPVYPPAARRLAARALSL